MNIVLLYHIYKSGLGGPGLIVRQVSTKQDIWARQKVRRQKGRNKKGAEQKGRRAKRAQSKKGAKSRCCVTVTFKVVISSDNRVLSQSFFFFF